MAAPAKTPTLLRRVARKSRQLLTISLITLALLEAVLWLFHPANTPECREVVSQDLPGLARQVTYDRNALGVRTTSLDTRDKPDRTIRLLAVGASTTDQATQNNPDMWSARLEKKLAAEFAPRKLRIEIGAYGRGGATVFDTLAWTRENAADLHADAVITLSGINDLAWHGGPDYSYDPATRDSRLNEGATHFFLKYSQIYRWSVRLGDQVRVRHALARGDAVEWHTRHLPAFRRGYTELPLRDPAPRDPDPFLEFRDGTDRFLGWLEANHLPALVVAQPVVWRPTMAPPEQALLWFTINTRAGRVRPSTAWLAAEMARYNAAQRDLAAQHHARFIDPQLPQTNEIFFDDCHFTDRGSQALADAIYPPAADLVREIATRNGW